MYTSMEQLYNKLLEKHGQVYVHQIDDDVYMYKILTKLEYETLISTIDDELDLQDAIVQTCILYPTDLNVDEMLPGDVYELAKLIVDESCVSLEDRLAMLELFTEEMGRIDNVICCFIIRAFPAYKFEDLEKMNYPDLYRLYTRAEWYLINIMREPLLFSAEQAIREAIEGPQQPQGSSDYYSNGHDEDGEAEQAPQQDMTQGAHMGRKLSEVMSEINNSGSKRKPMTDEQQRQLDEFKRQFPEMHMEADAMYTGLLSEKAGVVRGTPKQKY